MSVVTPPSPEDFQRLRESMDRLAAVAERNTAEVAEVRETAVPRLELRRRLWLAGAVLLVLMVVLVAWNRVTLQQSQEAAQANIVGCFLRPGDNTPAQAAGCARRNGGPVYAERQRQSREALGQFADLQRWAKTHGWTPPTTTEPAR